VEGIVRGRRIRSITVAVVLGVQATMAGPVLLVAAADSEPVLSAYLDGKPIALADVSEYYCDDFSYPVIECSASALVTSSRALVVSLLTSVDYVTVFENTSYGGAFMNISQDYTVLGLIGWNDRISSFKARNGETGTFYVDWFYNGSEWSFCCNTQQSTLGAYDNTFSSMHRT
jgi:hypothetical protein